MQPAESVEAYLRAPEGTYRCGPTWLHLCWTAEAFATFVWGRPASDDIRALVEVLRAEMTPHATLHVSHADMSGLDSVDPAAYTVLAEYLESVRVVSAARIRAQSVVYGPGLAGSIAAGFFTAYEAPFPFRAFREASEAAAWLDVAPETLGTWEELRARVASSAPQLVELRAYLDRAAAGATIGHAARALGVSERTLQRRLLESKTTFRRELDEARLAQARRRLETSEDKLHHLAHDLGFASHQHFTDWFRKLTGTSPSEHRRRSAAERNKQR